MSLKQAKANGISEQNYYARLNLGWSKEDASTKPVKKYKSHKKWLKIAQENGIEKGTYYHRVYQQGLSPEDASTLKDLRIKQKPWLELAEQNGIKRRTYEQRIHKFGWSQERAATEPPRTYKKSSIDDSYLTFKKKAMAKGIKVSEFNRRIFDEGMSLEEAIH